MHYKDMWQYQEESVFLLVNGLVTTGTQYEIDYFDGCNLMLIGSSDLTYYHQVEILFEEVLYIQFPSILLDPIEIRLATPSEQAQFKHLELAEEDKLFAMSCPSSFHGEPYFIAAERLKARRCQVYHYERENLQLSEEIWKRWRNGADDE